VSESIIGAPHEAPGPVAAAKLLPLVYRELRRLAASYLASEGRYHTLQPTALVHEAYLRMAKLDRATWRSKTHFFSVAATQMRRALVEHARAARTQKRGDGARRVTLEENMLAREDRTVEVLALDAALRRLARDSPRQARVAELRLFGGTAVRETAAILGVSERTVKGDWRVARAWIARELETREGS